MSQWKPMMERPDREPDLELRFWYDLAQNHAHLDLVCESDRPTIAKVLHAIADDLERGGDDVLSVSPN